MLDTIIRPFDFPNDKQFEDLDYDNDNVIEYFLNWILNCHNSQAKDFQKIKLGTVTVTDTNNYLARSSIEFLSTWEVINSRLLKTYGGYLVVKEVNGENVLDYLEEFTDTGYKDGNKLVCTQKIEFGQNLLDLIEETSGADIKTGIIPLGSRLKDSDGNETDKYLTIESLPDGTLSEGIVKTGDHILNTTLSENYGAIYEVVKWDDVTKPENLQSKAVSHIADSIKLNNEITIKAVDLKLTNEQIRTFEIGQYVRCYSDPHGIDDFNFIPNSTSALAKIYVYTYSGSTYIGSSSKDFTPYVPSSVVPTINSVTLTENTAGIASKFGCYVQGKSTIKGIVSASGAYSSTIKKYEIKINGQSFSSGSFTTNPLIGSGTCTVKITDSRSRTASKSASYSVVGYVNPTINTFTVKRCNQDGTESDEGAYAKCTFKATLSSVNNKNDKTFQLLYKKLTDSSYTTINLSNSSYSYNDTQIIEADINSEYEFIFKVKDLF